MQYPPLLDIIAAVQNPQLVKDPQLEGYEVFKYPSGKLSMYGGGFSQVFQMVCGGQRMALKVWVHEISNNIDRYEAIKAYLDKANLPYFVDFEYVKGGLLVNGQGLDILRMPWIAIPSLRDYINLHLKDPERLRALAANFLKMTADLHQHQISHGDLQYQNIFVTAEGEIKLIDYDSICIPELDGTPDVCLGTQGYQHPSRYTAGFFSSTKMDYFSELVIYLSILALSENDLLWDKYDVMLADGRLLFKTNDFYNFDISDIRKDLMLLSPQIKGLVNKMDSYLAAHLLLPPVAVS